MAVPAASFAIGPILAQGLGVEGRGEVAAATSLLLLLTAVGTIGLPESVSYFVAARQANGKHSAVRAALALAIAGVLLTACAWMIAPVLAGGDEGLVPLIRYACLALTPTLMIGALRGRAQGDARWGRVNAEKYISAAFRLLTLVALLFGGWLTPLSATIVLVLAPVVGGLAYVAWPGVSSSVGEELPRLKTSRMLAYSIRVWVGTLSGVLLTRLVQVIMTPLASSFELGIYATAVNIADLLLVANMAVSLVLFSADARDPDDERVFIASRLSVLATALTGTAIVVCAPWFIPLLFGEAFLPSLAPLMVLIAATVLSVPGSVCGTALGSRGRPEVRSWSLLAGAITSLAVLLIVVPTLGALGAAIATAGGSIVASTLNLIYAQRIFGLRIQAMIVPTPADVVYVWRAVRRPKD